MNTYDCLTIAISKNASIPNRSDLQDSSVYVDYLADPIGLMTLSGNSNSLIFGRRGTGKTLIAGALAERVNHGESEKEVIAFRYAAQDFMTSAHCPPHEQSVKDRAREHFNNFILALISDLIKVGEPRLYDESRWHGPWSSARKLRDQFLDTLTQCEELVRFGLDSSVPEGFSAEVRRTDISMGSSNSQIGVTVGGQPAGLLPNVALGGSIEAGRSAKTSAAVDMSYSLGARFSPADIKRLIVDAVELMGLDYIIIIIDEWMNLNDCQIEFAELLRRTLLNDNHIAIKITADQYQAEFSNGSYGTSFRGIELHEDVEVGADLDSYFSDLGNRETLLREALYRRLVTLEPEIGREFDEASRRFIGSVFQGSAFLELCRTSNGVCRDFFDLFRMCTKELGYRVGRNRRIDTQLVRRVASRTVDSKYRDADSNAYTRTAFFSVVMEHLKRTKSQFFLISRSKAGSSSRVIRTLMSMGLIGIVDLGEVDSALQLEYICYFLDYALYLNMMREFEFASGVGIDDVADGGISQLTAATAPSYVLDPSRLQSAAEDGSVCPRCSHSYSVSHKLVVKHGICPECLELIG